MKMLTIRRISTCADDYGTVKEEITLEFPDDYDETIHHDRDYHYVATENLPEYSITPLILALISVLLSMIYFLMY